MKTLALSLMMFITLVGYSQNPISFALYQDAKLLTCNDDHGNKSPTLDILLKLKIPLYKTEMSYIVVNTNYEHADLFGGYYNRYSFGFGYVLDNLIVKNVEINFGADYGYITRQHVGGLWSWGLSNEIAYKLTDKFKITILNQFVQRSDISTNKYSLFGGLEYKFN